MTSTNARMLALLHDYYGLDSASEASGKEASSDSSASWSASSGEEEEEEEEWEGPSLISPGPSPRRGRGSRGGGRGRTGRTDAAAAAAPAIDQQEFDAVRYVDSLLRTKQLQELVEIENSISGEKKAIDGDLQMLVYENYSKFISATDVIRAMEEKVSSMDSDMKELSSTMDSLRSQFDATEASIEASRESVAQLVGTKRLLSRLNFLFELPTTLKQCIVDRRFDDAVTSYKTSTKILAQYSHVRSFQAIRDETEQIVRELKSLLRAKIKESSDGCRLMSLSLTLLELGEPSKLLWHDLLTSQTDILLMRISEANSRKQLTQSLVPAFVEFATAFSSAFVGATPQARASPSRRRLTSPSSRRSTSPSSRRSVEQMEAYRALIQFSTSIFSRYFHDVRKLLLDIVNDAAFACGDGTEDINTAFEQLRDELVEIRTSLYQPSELVPDANLNKAADELFLTVIQRCTDLAFQRCHQSVVTFVSQLQPEEHQSVDDCARDAAGSIVEEFEVALSAVSALQVPQVPSVCTYVRSRFVAALIEYRDLLLVGQLLPSSGPIIQPRPSYTNTDTSWSGEHELDGVLNSNMLLLLSRLCLETARAPLPDIFESASVKFPASAEEQRSFDASCSSLVSEFAESSQVILGALAVNEGSALAEHLLHPSLPSGSPPQGLSSVVGSYLSTLSVLHTTLSKVFLDTNRSAVVHSTLVSRRPRPPLRRDDIERMFGRRITVFGSVAANGISPIFTALKVAFKAWLEGARRRRYSAIELQQLQVDVHAIRMLLPSALHSDSRASLDSLLAEVLTSALERCTAAPAEAVLGPDALQRIFESITITPPARALVGP